MTFARNAFLASLASLLILVVGPACTSGSSSECGANSCGACQSGLVNVDRCEDGAWSCTCVPRTGTEPSASSESVNGDGGSHTDANAPPSTATCQEQLAHPTEPLVCVAGDWNKSCAAGCLTCTCNGGQWGCTTNLSCSSDGG